MLSRVFVVVLKLRAGKEALGSIPLASIDSYLTQFKIQPCFL
jgi:hypothetical protein